MYRPKLTERRPSLNNIQRGVPGFEWVDGTILRSILQSVQKDTCPEPPLEASSPIAHKNAKRKKAWSVKALQSQPRRDLALAGLVIVLNWKGLLTPW